MIGIATLVVTLFPDLLPFAGPVDQNLGLGGMTLFFLWPLIIAQIVIGFFPMETKLQPGLAWGLLSICFLRGLSVCTATWDLVIGG